MGCDAGDVDVPGFHFHDEQHVEAAEEDRVDMKKSQASTPFA